MPSILLPVIFLVNQKSSTTKSKINSITIVCPISGVNRPRSKVNTIGIALKIVWTIKAEPYYVNWFYWAAFWSVKNI